jgi:hypothetical protein
MIAGISDPIKGLPALKQLADRVIDAHACATAFSVHMGSLVIPYERKTP